MFEVAREALAADPVDTQQLVRPTAAAARAVCTATTLEPPPFAAATGARVVASIPTPAAALIHVRQRSAIWHVA